MDPGGKKWLMNMKNSRHLVFSGLDLLTEGLLGFLLELESPKSRAKTKYMTFSYLKRSKRTKSVFHFCS
jgi:hypothetical protein